MPLRVLHVSESYGGGVVSAMQEYARSVTTADHHLLYAPRSDSPIDASDLSMFASATPFVQGHISRMRQIRKIARDGAFDVVHVHSSFAGAYVRLALSRRRIPIVYTPHCYAFEILSYPRPLRWLFWLAEYLLAFNTSGFAACSPREARLSRRRLTKNVVAYVPNAYTSRLGDPTMVPAERRELVGLGRVCTQKGPDFFAETFQIASAEVPSLKATWIGFSENSDSDLLEEKGVHVTGWMSRAKVRDYLRASNGVYLHSAVWEGFPIGILEAHFEGMPVVVRQSRSLEGFDFPASAATPTEAAAHVVRLLGPANQVEEFGLTSAALADNSAEVQGQRLSDLYANVSSTRSSAATEQP